MSWREGFRILDQKLNVFRYVGVNQEGVVILSDAENCTIKLITQVNGSPVVFKGEGDPSQLTYVNYVDHETGKVTKVEAPTGWSRTIARR